MKNKEKIIASGSNIIATDKKDKEKINKYIKKRMQRPKYEKIYFKDLLGQTLIRVEGAKKHSDTINFHTEFNSFAMYHDQDCCEVVFVENICGDIEDILHAPISMVEEVTNVEDEPLNKNEDSYTWTFYKIGTHKGSITIRWYGSSNGYYSEKVDFFKIAKEQE